MGNVYTDLVHIAPEVRWGVDFDVTCEIFDETTNTTTTKSERINLHTGKTVFNVKDSTRDEVNTWLLSQGYTMLVEPVTPVVVKEEL